MEFVRGLHNIKPYHKGCVLTIGNFDGFHRGHQSLISQLNEKKYILKLPLIVIIFEPQPQEYFSNIKTVRLTRLRDKIYYLFTAGVDTIICLTFNKVLASIEANTFIKKILIYKLGVKLICIGSDFRFGSYRNGDFNLLKKIGELNGIQVIQANTCVDKYGKKISSTAIKIALMENRIADAKLLMGHPYCVSGKIIHGNKLGRIIGIPTANIFLEGKKLPINGVYVVKVYGITYFPLPGIANIGIRPTIYDATQQQMEIHLFNIFQNLYFYHVKVVILKKIRDEQRFDSLKILKHQIRNDIIEAQNYLKKIYQKYTWNFFYDRL